MVTVNKLVAVRAQMSWTVTVVAESEHVRKNLTNYLKLSFHKTDIPEDGKKRGRSKIGICNL